MNEPRMNELGYTEPGGQASRVGVVSGIDEQRRQLRRMKRIALAMLVVAAAVFLAAGPYEDTRPWLGYVRAFAEASMVGGLADWFAVTALFRHPLGIPIPHTAIIAERKNEIGRGLGEFVRSNFLIPAVLEERIRAAHPAARLSAWLARPDAAGNVTDAVVRAVQAAGAALRDEEVQELLESQIRLRVEHIEAAPLVGRSLSIVLGDGRQAALVDGMLDRTRSVLLAQLPDLRKQFERESPWWVPEPIDDKVFNRIVTGVERLLADIRSDRTHPVRLSIESGITRALTEMQTDPLMIAKGEAWKTALLNHPDVREWIGSAWRAVRSSVEAELADRSSDLRRRLEDAVRQAGDRLARDPVLAGKVDDGVVRAVLSVAASSGDEVASLITTTVEKWNAEETVDRIETQIGRDLQFVRMNGTIVGGLIGLVLHALSRVL